MFHLRFLIIMAASIAMVVGVGVPAHADPTPGPDGGNSSLDALRANLASASEGYIKAEAELESSKLKQAGLQQQLTVAEAELARVRQRVAVYAAESYRTGRITALSLMLQATSTEDLIGRAETLDGVSRVDAGRLDGLAEAKARVAEAKSAIDAEVAKQSATDGRDGQA
jgi:peptidoglycan hydrolase CwlO-like protein